jgi:putative ABC transport system permease protein
MYGARPGRTFGPMTRALFREQVVIALRSIRGNLLRTVLTVAIIALGIMALISMTTATSSLEASVKKQFSTFGTQTLTLRQHEETGSTGGRRVRTGEPITYREAAAFAADPPDGMVVGRSVFGSFNETIAREAERTDPNVQVLGIDANYLGVSGFSVGSGRNLSAAEVNDVLPLVLLGVEVVDKLFAPWEDPVGAEIRIRNRPFTVVGVLAPRGRAFGMSQDNQVLVTLGSIRLLYADNNSSYSVACKVDDPSQLEEGATAALGAMRVIRGDRPGDPSSFDVAMSSAMVETLNQATGGITIAATVIGIITLFGAGIGLMNIMLVSVAERTREIGTRKALGATPRAIRAQFLIEVVLIGQIGGLTGILLGLLAGNAVASYLETPFVVPWGWMGLGLALSLATSWASGYYPARQASRLDPIAALGRE